MPKTSAIKLAIKSAPM